MARFRFASFFLFAASAACFATPVNAAESCSIVTLEAVAEKLPDYQPWTLLAGGPGRCRFQGERSTGRGRTAEYRSASLSVTQQFFDSPKTAASTLKSVKAEMEKTYTLHPLNIKGSGADSFAYQPNGVSSFHWHAQIGNALLSGSFITQKGQEEVEREEVDAILSLLQQAAAQTATPEAAAQTQQCPYFDVTPLKKIFTGKFNVQQFGSDSCMANDGPKTVLVFSLHKPITLPQTGQTDHEGCQIEKLPELGENGQLHTNCPGGKKRAKLSFIRDDMQYEYNLVLAGSAEPNTQQKSALIGLAKTYYDKR